MKPLQRRDSTDALLSFVIHMCDEVYADVRSTSDESVTVSAQSRDRVSVRMTSIDSRQMQWLCLPKIDEFAMTCVGLVQREEDVVQWHSLDSQMM